MECLLGVQLQLIHWGTHATPGLGDDAQEVVNRTMGDEYDLFIGIMWGRFGTPTGRADSGTEEEFNRALERYRRDPSSVDVMFYFKDTGIPPSRLDPKQLAAVQGFRQRLGKEGGLYWTFTSLELFQSFLRIHLSRKVQEWGDQQGGSSETAEVVSPAVAPTALEAVAQAEVNEVSELGLLDLIEVSEDSFNEAHAVMMRMVADLGTFTTQIRERTEEINGLSGVADRHKVQLAKRTIRRAAEDVNRYVERTNAELPSFAGALQTGLRAFGHAMSVATEFGPQASEQIRNSLAQVSSIRESIGGAVESTGGLRDAIAKWPRMTGDLIKAKKRAATTLDSLAQEMRLGDALLAEVEASLTEWLGGLE